MSARVPSVPEWTLAELVAHIAHAQWWAGRIVESRAQERPPKKDLPETPPPEALAHWLTEATERLLIILRNADLDVPVWSWTGRGNAAFWSRRMAHEVGVHRWDAQLTAGAPRPLDTALAADGIDEVFELMAAIDPGRFKGQDEAVHLHATDAGLDRVVRLGRDGLAVLHASGPAAVSVHGTASDLDLWLWGRPTADALRIEGDRALAERLVALTTA